MDPTNASEDRTRERAYSLWKAEGCPDGCAERHWQQAEAELFQDAEGEDMAEASSDERDEGAVPVDAPVVPVRSRRRA